MAINAIAFTQGPARPLVDAADVTVLRRAGVLVEDPRRQRPRYFDGRFLAARDLIRDQQYFLTRESDLGRSSGSGVANGLFVRPGESPHHLVVTEGQGVTPAGELVLLPDELRINLADVPQAEQLSARFGLSRLPVPPLRSRTGLFVLALRPVEFTANPIGAYPTTLTGPRTVEDGDVIEATALVLVPWQDDGASDALEARRARAARVIFVGDGHTGLSANVLPLAMIALQSNTIVWIDEAMVRRELGADRGDIPGLGFSPRALRVAHLIQHQDHLADTVARLQGQPFAAASQFPALPPAGPLPPGIIDARDFTQRYFPSEVDVDFSIIPDDELPALVEESLALPPIDFSASQAALDLTAVLVLAPVPRDEFRAVLARLQTRTRVLRPAPVNLVAQRKPLEILQRLRLPAPLLVPDLGSPADAEWARLARQSNLWFVRRRNLAYRDELAGAPVVALPVNEIDSERAVRERLTQLGLGERLKAVLNRASARAAPRVLNLLGAPRFAESPVLAAAALGALASARGVEGQLDEASVFGVAGELGVLGTGDGLRRLERASARGIPRETLVKLASTDEWRELDRKAREAGVEALPGLLRLVGAVPAPIGDRVPATRAPARKKAPVGAGDAAASAPEKTSSKSSSAALGRKAAPKPGK